MKYKFRFTDALPFPWIFSCTILFYCNLCAFIIFQLIDFFYFAE